MDKDVALYQQISTEFNKVGVVEALVLTTFGLDVSYLEKSILPAFFPHLGEGPATEPHRPLFEYLEDTPTPISVLYDANNLVRGETVLQASGSVTKELRWQAHPVIRAQGCFHPKLIIAQVRNGDQLSLVLGCSSANLTRPGWGQNYEACAIELIPLQSGVKSSLLVDVSDLLEKLRDDAPISDAIGILLKTIIELKPQGFSTRGYQSDYRSRLWFGQNELSLSQWLRQEVLRGDLAVAEAEWRLEVLSPYFSVVPPKMVNWASQQFIKRGSETTSPPILCLCPHDGEVFDVEPEVVAAFDEIEHFAWAEFPTDRLRSQLQDKDGNKLRRFLHAKVYRFWTPRYEVLVVGSANASTQGNRDASPGNDEACLVFSRTVAEGAKPLTPWLRPLEYDIQASDCRTQPKPAEDKMSADPVPMIVLIFDWQSHVLSIDNKDSRSLSVHIGSGYTPLLTILAGKKKKLQLDTLKTQSLFRSPTVKVALPSSTDMAWLCLVEEFNLHAKPPAPTMERDVDDLIRDWQMAADERQANHVARAGMPDDLRASSEGSSPELDDVVDQDRLNDIFLAMWRFKSELLRKLESKDALDDFSRLQIQSRLFGNGAMSVRYFASKLNRDAHSLATPKIDPVEQYIALLSLYDSAEVLRKPAGRHGFKKEMKKLMADLAEMRNAARAAVIIILEEDPLCPNPAVLVEWVEANYSRDAKLKVAS
jgi:hypothetical protein